MSDLERLERHKQERLRRLNGVVEQKELELDFMNASLEQLREDYRRQRIYSPLLGNPFLELPFWMNPFLNGGSSPLTLHYQAARFGTDVQTFQEVELPSYRYPAAKQRKSEATPAMKELGEKFDRLVAKFLKKLFRMILKFFFKLKTPEQQQTKQESLESLRLTGNNYYRFLLSRRKRRRRSWRRD